MRQTMELIPGQIYRHFKGKLYQIIGVAEHTETGENLVIYQALYGAFGIYARPYEMFVSKVDRTKYSVEEYPQQYRFERVIPGQLTEIWKGSSDCVSAEYMQSTDAQSGIPASCNGEQTVRKKLQTGQEFLMAFLETDSYREKLDILRGIGDDCTENIVNSMALSLDMGLKGSTVEECMEEIRQCLMLHLKYEGRRK